MEKNLKNKLIIGTSIGLTIGASVVAISIDNNNRVSPVETKQVQVLTWNELQDYVDMGNIALKNKKEFSNISFDNPIEKIIQGEIVTYDFSKTKFKNKDFLQTKFSQNGN